MIVITPLLCCTVLCRDIIVIVAFVVVVVMMMKVQTLSVREKNMFTFVLIAHGNNTTKCQHIRKKERHCSFKVKRVYIREQLKFGDEIRNFSLSVTELCVWV